MNTNRRAKSCGKYGQKTPLEIASRFPLSHSFNNNKLDDPDHFLENPSASVASLRPLIGSPRNSDRDQIGMPIGFIGIPTLRRYIVFRIKAMEFMDLNTVRDGLVKGGINYAAHLRPPIFTAQSIRTVVLSYFALFVDKNGMDVIELWKEVFPKHRKRVEDTWSRIEPTWVTIRKFRDSAGFHADKPMKFFGARYRITKERSKVDEALKEFITLFQFFLSAETKGELPDLETELDSLLEDLSVSQPETYQREQFKAYLMLTTKNIS